MQAKKIPDFRIFRATMADSSTASKESSKDEKAAAKANAGIPKAEFVEDVDQFMKQPGNGSVELVLKRFDEQYKKYKFLEANLVAKRKRLRSQIPDIETTLKTVKFMKSKQESPEPLTTHYLLSDGVYATAEVPPTDKVLLWLGANVMLEYTTDEAMQLLEKNLGVATKSLEEVQGDIDFCKDQVTTVEVAMARVYNWDVQQRKKKETSSSS